MAVSLHFYLIIGLAYQVRVIAKYIRGTQASAWRTGKAESLNCHLLVSQQTWVVETLARRLDWRSRVSWIVSARFALSRPLPVLLSEQSDVGLFLPRDSRPEHLLKRVGVKESMLVT